MTTRRETSEIAALLNRERGLCHVYVEGDDDARLLETFLDSVSCDVLDVYPIRLIHVSDQIIRSNDLSKGSSKSRLIGLSYELTNRNVESQQCMCIADRDFGFHLDRAHRNELLRYTDFASMELYCFNEKCLGNFFRNALRDSETDVGQLKSHLETILQKLFVLRLTNELLGWGLSLPEESALRKRLIIEESQISLDEESFIRVYLQNNDRLSDLEQFQSAKEDAAELLEDDLRQNIRGHDIATCLYHIVQKIGTGSRPFDSPRTIQGVLYSGIEARDLLEYSLFRKLQEICRAHR